LGKINCIHEAARLLEHLSLFYGYFAKVTLEES
jgi:hypothetical protein